MIGVRVLLFRNSGDLRLFRSWQTMWEVGKDMLRTKTEIWREPENRRNIGEGHLAKRREGSKTSIHPSRHCSSGAPLPVGQEWGCGGGGIQKGTQPNDIIFVSYTE